jgi:hypothetical protein
MLSGCRSRTTFFCLLSLLLAHSLKTEDYQLVSHDVSMKAEFIQEALEPYVKWLPEKLSDNDRRLFNTYDELELVLMETPGIKHTATAVGKYPSDHREEFKKI